MKKNYVYALISVFIWSTFAPVAKLVLSNIPDLEALSISAFFAFLFLLLMNIKNGSIKIMKNYSVKDYAVMAGLGFLGMFLYSALYYYGLNQLTSQEACILNYLWPIMLVVFSVIILKERLTVSKVLAMLCSFLGIVILSSGSGGANTDGNITLGIISCIVAAACYGLYSVLNKKADYNQNITMMIVWLFTAICSAALGLLTESWTPIIGTQWIGVAWLGIIVNAIAYLLWALSLRGVESTAKIANLAYLTPFLSLIVSYFLLGEKIKSRALIALVFIVGGILIQSLWEYIRARRKA